MSIYCKLCFNFQPLIGQDVKWMGGWVQLDRQMATMSAPNSLDTATLKSSMTHPYLTSKFQAG